MNLDLRQCIHQYLRVVGAALVPVVLVAFLSIPFNLGAHPGEVPREQSPASRHMT